MEDLFRLVLLRPAVAKDDARPSLDLSQSSDYQERLHAAVTGDEVRPAAEELSREFVASPAFFGRAEDNPFAEQLRVLARLLASLEVNSATLPEAVARAFDSSPEDLVASEEFTAALHRLRDSILAVKVLQEEHARPLAELVDQLRLMDLVVRIVEDRDLRADEHTLTSARRRSVQLPGAVRLPSRLSTRAATTKLRAEVAALRSAREAHVAELLEQHEAVRASLAELARIDAGQLSTTVQVAGQETLPPEELQTVATAVERARFLDSMRTLQVQYAEAAVQAPERTGEVDALRAAALTDSLLPPAQPLQGRPEFKPQRVSFTVEPQIEGVLSARTQTLLGSRGLDVTQTPLDRVADSLQLELAALVGELEQLAGHPTTTVLKRIGSAVLAVRTPITTGWGAIGTGGLAPTPTLAMDGRVPQTRGEVAPAGLADLLLVRQQLVRYEGADVAHIENVLQGERKLREHTRRQESVLTTLTETEVSSAEERELESTNRFEMTREASQTIKEDLQLKAGLKVSGKYGPVVEFAVSAEGSYQRTKEEATKSASKFSQDVTERSSRKIAERTLDRTTMVVTNEVLEKNSHEVNNVGGAGHVTGVYQWVNKVYRAQMFNYGLRAMFDFMVPEPAAFVIAALNHAHASSLTLTKPAEFTLLPSQVNQSNYGYWVRLYGATDVAPPPELYKTAALDFKAGGGDDKTNYNHTGQIAIDEGYRAVWATIGVVGNIWDKTRTVDVVLGQRTHRLSTGEWLWSTAMADERGTVPVAIDTFRMSQVAVAIEVKCQRTDRAMQKWQLETHGKLATAHKARVAEYEEKLAALQLEAGPAIEGRNPEANRVTIEQEMKKNCISILTDQHFDLFNAIEPAAGTGLPQADLFEAAGEGPYVRFFEQAFEWEHMSWVTYPYFWGRKSEWDERLAYEDPDPAFSDFLRAGYARVTVPARPGFETAIDHFLTFGDIWNGGPLPAVTNPLFVTIADELAERLGRPESEVPQGEPWTVRVPTTLVRLRPDGELPSWVEQVDGSWAER